MEFVPYLISYYSRYANPAGVSQPLQPGGYIDPIAIDVIRFGDHVTEVDADPEGDALVLWRVRISVGHSALDLDSAPDSIDHARKLSQKAVAGVLHDPASMLLALRVDQLPEVRLQPFVRPLP